MKLIYAMNEAGGTRFAVATTPSALPVGAYVYAICDGASVCERVTEEAYDELPAIEYLKLKQMVVDARRSELKRVYGTGAKTSTIHRLREWLTGADDDKRENKVKGFGDLIGNH
jgi:hypothetical protein